METNSRHAKKNMLTKSICKLIVVRRTDAMGRAEHNHVLYIAINNEYVDNCSNQRNHLCILCITVLLETALCLPATFH